MPRYDKRLSRTENYVRVIEYEVTGAGRREVIRDNDVLIIRGARLKQPMVKVEPDGSWYEWNDGRWTGPANDLFSPDLIDRLASLVTSADTVVS